jgi:hypothetical protein
VYVGLRTPEPIPFLRVHDTPHGSCVQRGQNTKNAKNDNIVISKRQVDTIHKYSDTPSRLQFQITKHTFIVELNRPP